MRYDVLKKYNKNVKICNCFCENLVYNDHIIDLGKDDSNEILGY